MPIQALRSHVQTMAEMGLNTLLIEWEASFPYQKHAIIPNQYAYTSQEIKSFIGYCKTLGIDVIPLQQCFGHIEYILQHERYAHLREDQTDLCQLCPSKIEEALLEFKGIFKEIAEAHPSPYIHIGGDETYLLGHCKVCQEKAKEFGKSKLYVDYFKQIAEMVVKMGKRPLIWADMLLKHPETVHEMPKESVFVDWNYGWATNRFGELSKIKENQFEFWGAPALRSHPDNHSLTRWENHFNNLRDYLPFTRQSGFKGIILTSWSTSGLYGYQWANTGEVSEIYPNRRVYPLPAFRILLEAFSFAIQQEDRFVPKNFVIQYAQSRFGLTSREGGLLWDALTEEAVAIEPGCRVAPILKKSKKALAVIQKLKPNSNREEFEHLRLMTETRVNYLQFKKLEEEVNSKNFKDSLRSRKVVELKKILKVAEKLNQRFLKLNCKNLYPGELKEETDYRLQKLRRLLKRLARSGRAGFKISK